MFNQFPVQYIEPVFRPPSEAHSLIIQVTNGGSWNRCTYCEMYTDPQKKFRPRVEAEVLDEIRRSGETGLQPRRVFLADGDAMVFSARTRHESWSRFSRPASILKLTPVTNILSRVINHDR